MLEFLGNEFQKKFTGSNIEFPTLRFLNLIFLLLLFSAKMFLPAKYCMSNEEKNVIGICELGHSKVVIGSNELLQHIENTLYIRIILSDAWKYYVGRDRNGLKYFLK